MKTGLLTVFEVTAYGSALLLLPCALAGLFGCNLSYILIPVILGSATGTAILTGIAVREGWYFDHLSGEEVTRERVEPAPGPRRNGRIVESVLRDQKAAHLQAIERKNKAA